MRSTWPGQKSMLRESLRGRRRALAVAAALVAWGVAAWTAAEFLTVKADLSRADVIVVLAGASTYVERTRHAAKLFHEGRAPKIALTDDQVRGGYSPERDRNPFFVERAADELRQAGVPTESIEVITGPAVGSTHDEAKLLREYASARGLRSVLVVTSAYHSRRALWTLRRVFRGSGVEVGLDPVAPGGQSPAPATWWLHGLGWKMVAGEYLKMAYYLVCY